MLNCLRGGFVSPGPVRRLFRRDALSMGNQKRVLIHPRHHGIRRPAIPASAKPQEHTGARRIEERGDRPPMRSIHPIKLPIKNDHRRSQFNRDIDEARAVRPAPHPASAERPMPSFSRRRSPKNFAQVSTRFLPRQPGRKSASPNSRQSGPPDGRNPTPLTDVPAASAVSKHAAQWLPVHQTRIASVGVSARASTRPVSSTMPTISFRQCRPHRS